MGFFVIAEPAVDAQPHHDDSDAGGDDDEEDAANDEPPSAPFVADLLVFEV